MNKELIELMETLAERRKVEDDSEASIMKLDAKIGVLMAKIQAKITPPKPVEVEAHTRGKPRKERSDKGQPRNPIAQAPIVPSDASGDEPDDGKGIGTIAGHLKEG